MANEENMNPIDQLSQNASDLAANGTRKIRNPFESYVGESNAGTAAKEAYGQIIGNLGGTKGFFANLSEGIAGLVETVKTFFAAIGSGNFEGYMRTYAANLTLGAGELANDVYKVGTGENPEFINGYIPEVKPDGTFAAPTGGGPGSDDGSSLGEKVLAGGMGAVVGGAGGATLAAGGVAAIKSTQVTTSALKDVAELVTGNKAGNAVGHNLIDTMKHWDVKGPVKWIVGGTVAGATLFGIGGAAIAAEGEETSAEGGSYIPENVLAAGQVMAEMTIPYYEAGSIALSEGEITQEAIDSAAIETASWAGFGAGATGGALIGGTIGSAVPILGTAVGAGVGGLVGGIAGSLGAGWLAEQGINNVAPSFNTSAQNVEVNGQDWGQQYVQQQVDLQKLVMANAYGITPTAVNFNANAANNGQTAPVNPTPSYEPNVRDAGITGPIANSDYKMGMALGS